MTARLRKDDLQCGGLFLWQDPAAFCFGTDAVLLADFARVPDGGAVADLGCGNGVVALLLSDKTQAGRIVGLEIQPEAAALAARNFDENGLSGRAQAVCGDLRMSAQLLGAGTFDTVVCNPPYYRAGCGLLSDGEAQRLARHEIAATMDDVAQASAALLRPGGKLYLVHRPHRLTDVLAACRGQGLEPKRLRLVCPREGKPPHLFLLEACRGGRPELRVMENLYLHRMDGGETEELRRIYGRENG